MKKAFLVLCIVAVGLLGLNMLPGRTATADSEFVIGDLSKLAQDLEIVPEDNGGYSLADILEAFYTKVENANKQISALESTVTEINNILSNLQVEVHNIRQGAVGVSVDQLNNLGDWTEGELHKLWDKLNSSNVESRLQRIEGALRSQSGGNFDSRLYDIERHLQQIEYKLQQNNNDYRLQQIEYKIEYIENQLHGFVGTNYDYRLSRIEDEINRLWSRVGH